MDLKGERILILSIIIVLISSWFVGNLMDFRREGAEEPLFSGVPVNIFLGSVVILILLSLLYFSFLYFRFEGDKRTILSGLLLFGFWIFTFLGGLLFVIYGFWPFILQLDLRVPLKGDSSTIPFFTDVGFILLLGLIALLFLYLIFAKITKEKGRKGDMDALDLDGLEKTIEEEKDEKEVIEDSLSSTLDRAIVDIDEGEDVRTTIIRCYREMSRFLERMGAKNEVSMTPREFQNIIIEEMPGAENMISEITFLFEEARYSPHELGERERDKVLQHLKELKEGIG